jgi:hypothetical protein
MQYLYLFILMIGCSVIYLPIAYFVFSRLLGAPISEINFGIFKAVTVRLGRVPFNIGWIPLNGSVTFEPTYLEALSSRKWWMHGLVNFGVNACIWIAVLLMSQVSWQTLKDCFAVTYFQMTIGQFTILHGPIGIGIVGAFLVAIIWISHLPMILVSKTKVDESSTWSTIVLSVCWLGSIFFFVRLCILLWGL